MHGTHGCMETTDGRHDCIKKHYCMEDTTGWKIPLHGSEWVETVLETVLERLFAVLFIASIEVAAAEGIYKAAVH